ncbi:hypothetical protein GLOIN_2v583658 [Rhizophagus irregularis DAOM 181602=DAOM 197198]|nr:hypothetical protein GLOIN_2v583658 [Rhizophagus irregularis DAOM 181602=DAOM 197198]
MLLLSTSRYNNSHWDVVKTDSLKPLELKKAPSIPSGMSRFLDEIESLLRHCINESDEKIRNDFANLVVISTTYENGSAANIEDIRIRKKLAMRK